MENKVKMVYAIIRDCGDGSGTIDLVSSKSLAEYLMSEERADMLHEYEYYLSEGSYTEIPTIGLEDYQLMKPSDLYGDDLECYKKYAKDKGDDTEL